MKCEAPQLAITFGFMVDAFINRRIINATFYSYHAIRDGHSSSTKILNQETIGYG